MGQLVKLVLILIMIVFTAVMTALVVGWLVTAVLTTAAAWLAGGATSCVTAWAFFHHRGRRCRRTDVHARTATERRDLDRALESTLATVLSALTGSALAVIVIACGPHEGAPTIAGYACVSVALTVLAACRAVPLIQRLHSWRAGHGIGATRTAEQAAPEVADEKPTLPAKADTQAVEAAYAMLQTDRSADDSTLKLHYRKLVWDFHPDRSQRATPAVRALAEERLKEVNRALATVMRSRGTHG